jgi:biotin carboxyl carrier protein
MQLFAELLATARFQQAGMLLVTRLAELVGCEKVSFGLVRRRRVRIESVSHSAQHEKKMAVQRRIENAMHEALMQRKSVLCERGVEPGALITREHEMLLDDADLAGVLSVPLYDGDSYYGALCFERVGQAPFTAQQVQLAESVAQIGGLLLKRMRAESANIVSKNFTALGALAGGIVGPRYLGRKLVALLLLAVVLFFSVVDGEYWEAGDSVLEGEVKRTLVVPFNGYVDSALHKAGDTVRQGDLLATLEDRDLVLERLKLVSERNQITKQYLDAVGRHESVEVQIAKARLEQVEAQLAVVELNIERTQITAPFDGVIIEGDLSQLLGSAVNKGDSLFIVSPLDRYRVVILVDERRINEIAVGQRAVMVLNAEPERRHAVLINRVTPEVQVLEGSAFFRVEGALQESVADLRPGLEGITKIYVDERKLIGIWTRGLREWLKINLWALIP